MGHAGALAHLHEHQRAVARIAHHEVDLATAAARGSIIARDQQEPGRLQVGQGRILGRVAALFGGDGMACRPVPEKTH